MLKSDIIWPKHRRYKSRTEWEPIGFFSDCLCNSTQFDLMLGFFSSSAISVLANGFSVFLYNGGKMRLIINDILTEEDKKAINIGQSDCELPFFDITNIEQFKEILSERDTHFFNCLAWLIRNDRLEVKIIRPKNGIGIAHTKAGVFSDATNIVGYDGSCNFSKTALVENIESITVACDWDGEISQAQIEDIKDNFNLIFQEKDSGIEYVATDDITTNILTNFPDKSLQELLEAEQQLYKNNLNKLPQNIQRALNTAQLRVDKIIENIKQETQVSIETTEPHFPHSTGPREYQRQAFENWKNNKQKGLFAMATGTGKTITSLNCLLEIYLRLKYYKAIILVPTITLVEQWENECIKFGFDSIIKVCSKYKSWKSRIGEIGLMEQVARNDKSQSYIIIATYASYIKADNFLLLNSLSAKQVLFIADEAHNMGAGRIAQRLNEIPYLRRIGLSATPERQFDIEGNLKLHSFFGCTNSTYTFEYSMREAIDNGALCRFYYYPHLVRLTPNEMEKYIDISKKIAQFINATSEEGKEYLKKLLLIRKQIIHKAENKKVAFKEILKQRYQLNGDLRYTLIYVPEGNKPDDQMADVFENTDIMLDDSFDIHLIDEYTKLVRDIAPRITVSQFISGSRDRDEKLQAFARGDINVLTSMKCLDEGVDVPRSEFAIFCASTGNPRQFIQRRGRVLRTHKDKKYATIHDLVVIPEVYNEECYEVEKSLVAAELRRVRDFALLSENCNDTVAVLDPILDKYILSLFSEQ